MLGVTASPQHITESHNQSHVQAMGEVRAEQGEVRVRTVTTYCRIGSWNRQSRKRGPRSSSSTAHLSPIFLH